jgi:threonine dehydrogenase-like Zn-dependent dehydrogenase
MGAHGYFTEYAIDAESDLVKIPPKLIDVAILIEPLSVVEKAIDTALALHRYGPRTALVIGAGAVGILAALTLRARGLHVRVCSLEEPGSARAALIGRAGFPYVKQPPGDADIVIEAAGTADAGSAAVNAMAPLGVLIVLGAATVRNEFPLMKLILNNQVVAGSVNASPYAFHQAVKDLGEFPGDVLNAMIHRLPFCDFSDSILGPPQEIPKIVHVING